MAARELGVAPLSRLRICGHAYVCVRVCNVMYVCMYVGNVVKRIMLLNPPPITINSTVVIICLRFFGKVIFLPPASFFQHTSTSVPSDVEGLYDPERSFQR